MSPRYILQYGMKRCVIFDLDGTLLDTIADLAKAMNRVLVNMELPVHQIEKYKRFVGEGIINLVRRSLPPTERREEIVRQAAAAMRQEYSRCWHEESRPYEGIPELIHSLKERGLVLSVLSNKPHAFVTEMVDRLLPGGSFACILGMRDGVNPKPDPAAALEITIRLDAPPEDFLFLGDTKIDMQTALRAGMFPVGALWGFRSEEEILAGGAAATIEEPRQLLQYLD
jgi:phosphoglycolate phosphatase